LKRVIKGGTVVTAAETVRTDVGIDGGQVAAIGHDLDRVPGVAEVIDASGCYVFPGGVDPHTHLEMPIGPDFFTADDWYSGTVAAACGGTTCVLDFATQEKGGTLAEAVVAWQQRAAKAVIDYGFHLAVVDPHAVALDELERAPERWGIKSFKIYLAYKNRIMVDDAGAFRVLRAARRAGGVTMVHCENGEVVDLLIREALAKGQTEPFYHALTRPALAEAEATERAIRLADMAMTPVYIVHVTCREALDAIVSARRRGGFPVYAETCAHYLALTGDAVYKPGWEAAKYVLSPPLRSEADRESLWTALRRGQIDTVASDHCPWCLDTQKVRGKDDFSLIPNGGPCIEDRFAVTYMLGVYEKRITLNRFVSATSTAAARIFGLYPQKGTIAPGSDADIVVWDPHGVRTLSVATQKGKCDYNLFEGMQVVGRPRYVLSRGRTIVQEGEFTGEAGWGRYLARR
jgi:dihydropyrimidinase